MWLYFLIISAETLWASEVKPPYTIQALPVPTCGTSFIPCWEDPKADCKSCRLSPSQLFVCSTIWNWFIKRSFFIFGSRTVGQRLPEATSTQDACQSSSWSFHFNEGILLQGGITHILFNLFYKTIVCYNGVCYVLLRCTKDTRWRRHTWEKTSSGQLLLLQETMFSSNLTDQSALRGMLCVSAGFLFALFYHISVINIAHATPFH